MAGRPKGSKARKAVMGEEHRAKIRNSNLLNRLIMHGEGKAPEMTQSEVSAAMGLLGFAFPKLQPVVGEGGGDATVSMKVTIGGD